MAKKRQHRRRHRPGPVRPEHGPIYEWDMPATLCAWAPACVLSPAWVVAGIVEHPCGHAVVGVSLVCDGHRPAAVAELGQHIEPIVASADELAEVLAEVDGIMRDAEREARRRGA